MKPRKPLTTLMLIGVVMALAAMTTTAIAQEEPPPAGEGQLQQADPEDQLQMMTDMLYLERTWTTLCFQIQLTPEQFQQLGQLYAQVLQQRNVAAQEALQEQDIEAYQEAGVEAKTTLQEMLPEVLEEEQWQQLQATVGAFDDPQPRPEPEVE